MRSFAWGAATRRKRAGISRVRSIARVVIFGHADHAISERGLAPYGCGYAMGSNPMPFLLPCHRVTRGHETLGDYVGGPVMRERLERA